nr:aminoacyl-tRNA synthetase, class 1a, anticodon-binding [Tanacetum cinerariifolium]
DFNIPPGGASNNRGASTSVPVDVPTSANVPTGSTSVLADVPTSVAPAELQRRRQQEVLTSAMYYTKADWINIMAQSCAVYSTGWSMAHMKSFTNDQLKEEFEKIQKALSNIQIQAFSKTLKRTGPVLEEPSSKRRKKSLGRKRLTKPKSKLKELDLDADAQTFIMVVSNEDSKDEAPLLWSALVGWEVITTPLKDINALYRIDRSTAHFTTLREILHMVDRQDLVTLYRLVVKYYANHPDAGAGLILSWRPYTLSNVHVLETVSGEVVYMFADVSYPFSVKLMERMLKHKLEIDKDVVGNDMTTADQLIRFIKNQLVAAQDSKDEAPLLWSALVGWEVITTPLKDINALYRIDRSTAHFTTLREILHMVDRQDLVTLYRLVVKYYANHPDAGAGLILSWRPYTLSNVHVLETVSGEVVYMFADVSYPFSVKLMERMLKHKLEIDKDVVGNDMTTADQLIRFIKNQLVAAQVSTA